MGKLIVSGNSRIRQRVGGAAVSSFSPVTGIGWHSAYWADGPEMLALGVANGAAVATFPDEVGTENATASITPTYNHSSASFNNKRVISFDGATNHRLNVTSVSVSNQPQPFTTVVIGRFSNIGLSGAGGPVGNATGPGMIDGGPATTAFAGRLRLSAPSPPTVNYALQAGASGTERKVGSANTNAHCFMMYWNGAGSRFEVDGTGIALGGSPGASAWQGINLGYPNAAGSTPWRLIGEIAFVGVYFGDVETDAGWAAFKTWALSFYGITIA